MPRYMTPRGVVVEVADEAARAVGYKPVAEPSDTKAEPKRPVKKAPAKKAAASKSSK